MHVSVHLHAAVCANVRAARALVFLRGMRRESATRSHACRWPHARRRRARWCARWRARVRVRRASGGGGGDARALRGDARAPAVPACVRDAQHVPLLFGPKTRPPVDVGAGAARGRAEVGVDDRRGPRPVGRRGVEAAATTDQPLRVRLGQSQLARRLQRGGVPARQHPDERVGEGVDEGANVRYGHRPPDRARLPAFERAVRRDGTADDSRRRRRQRDIARTVAHDGLGGLDDAGERKRNRGRGDVGGAGGSDGEGGNQIGGAVGERGPARDRSCRAVPSSPDQRHPSDGDRGFVSATHHIRVVDDGRDLHRWADFVTIAAGQRILCGFSPSARALYGVTDGRCAYWQCIATAVREH